MQLVRYSGSEDWSALYVDGVLDRVGDHYLIDERISQLMNVVTYDSDDFMRGGKCEKDVAQTLTEVQEYVKVEADKQSQKEKLEQEIAELQNQLKDLE